MNRSYDECNYPEAPEIVGRGSDISFTSSTQGGMWCPLCFFLERKYHWIENVTEGKFSLCNQQNKKFQVTREHINRKHL